MLEVSQSWEDSVWAYYKTMVDVASERFLQCIFHLKRPWQYEDQLELPDQYFEQQCSLDDLSEVFEKIACSADRVSVSKSIENTKTNPSNKRLCREWPDCSFTRNIDS